MDLFSSLQLQDELTHGDFFLWDLSLDSFDLPSVIPGPLPAVEPPVVPRSAFSRYVKPESELSMDCSSTRPRNERNIHRQVMGILRRIPTAPEENNKVGECSRGFRHMMRERQRRERLSQSYADLHTMLPYRSKADKNSIVKSAVAYVKELVEVKEELARCNGELRMRASRISNFEGSKIKIRVANPISTLDSMIGALQCLKAMDVKATAIQAEFSGRELTTVMAIQTKEGAGEAVERAVERALMNSCCI